MSASPTEPPAEAPLEERRYWLARQQFALDNSWPRKWGTVVGGPLIAAIVSLSVFVASWMQHGQETERTAAEQKTQQDRTYSQQRIDNNRTALDMYFRYVADKPEDSPHRSDHMRVIQAIAADQNLLGNLTTVAIDTRHPGQTPSEASVGLHDVKSQPAGHVYGPGDFLAYVQYPALRADASRQVTEALGGLGLKVPGQQAMPPEKSPRDNQIRIYREAHRTYAQMLATQLQQRTGLVFAVKLIGGGSLPNGVMEIWLGKGA